MYITSYYESFNRLMPYSPARPTLGGAIKAARAASTYSTWRVVRYAALIQPTVRVLLLTYFRQVSFHFRFYYCYILYVFIYSYLKQVLFKSSKVTEPEGRLLKVSVNFSKWITFCDNYF